MTSRSKLMILAAAAGLVAGLGACHRPQGAMLSYTGESITYYSTEYQPKSVELLDLRTGEVLFAMDIPAGKQLTIDFVPGEGDDPVYTPDLMRWEVFDLGSEFGKLTNSMTVPTATSRRLDYFLRPGPEYVTAAPDESLRTDELRDRPEWWTPEGGPMPEDNKGTDNYER